MNGRVYIVTGVRENRTYLKDSFTSMPFKIADIREDITQCCLDLMLMSSSPGMLSSDDYRFKIDIIPKSALSLKTQSYQRFFSMKKNASMRMDVKVNEDSFFEFIPHPTVPHKDADVNIINDINIKNGAEVIWGDLISCGRKLNGERFEYSRVQNKTTFYFDGKPKIIEQLVLSPKENDVQGLGQLEGYTHMASLYFVGTNLDLKGIKERINDLLSESKIERIAAATLTPFKGVVVKFLSHQSESLYDEIIYLVAQIRKEFYSY